MTRKDYLNGIDNIKAGYQSFVFALNEQAKHDEQAKNTSLAAARDRVEKTVCDFIESFGVLCGKDEAIGLTSAVTSWRKDSSEEAKKKEEEAKKEGKKVKIEHVFKITESKISSYIVHEIFEKQGIDYKAKLEKEKKAKKEKTEEELQLIHENRQAKQLMKASTEALLTELKRREEEEKHSIIVTNKSVIA